MSENAPPPSLPVYHGPDRATADQAKPLMKMLGKMMTKRLHLPHGKVNSQNIKIKQKKVKYY